MTASSLFSTAVLFLLLTATFAKKTAKEDGPPDHPCQKYLDMSDFDLFFEASEGRRVGEHCRIKNSPQAACDFYVVAEASAATGYDGWPRSYEDRGRGCVYHPEGKGKCSYLKNEYRQFDQDERAKMCAGDYVANAAAQLRHAILHDKCGGKCSLPECHLGAHEKTRPWCFHCRKCKGNMEDCKEGYKFCKLCREECPEEYQRGENKRGDEL